MRYNLVVKDKASYSTIFMYLPQFSFFILEANLIDGLIKQKKGIEIPTHYNLKFIKIDDYT